MSKSKTEIILEMIEAGTFSFEEIVMHSGAKAAYVKGVFSKNGLKWEDFDDPEVELKTILVPEEEVTEEPVEEVTEEGADGEVKDDEQPQDSEEIIAEEEAEEVTEEPVEEVTEEETVVEAPKDLQLKPDLEIAETEEFKIAEHKLHVANNAIVQKSIKNRSRRYREACDKILEEKVFKARDLQALISMYKVIRPFPMRLNSNKSVHGLHLAMTNLYRVAKNSK